MGYDDAVSYNSRAYRVGVAAGEINNAGLMLANPCALAGAARTGLKVINGVNSAASALDAGDAFRSGDYLGGLDSLMAARASFGQMLQACFVAGTPILTASGASKPVESFVGYEEAGDGCDWVLSRDEHDAAGAVLPRRVLRTFARVSVVLEVYAGGHRVGTTGEHPFWVEGKGWTPAGELAAGDVLVGHGGQRVPVDGVEDTRRVVTVYNMEVEGDHTYFVGGEEWGFSVWAHNAKGYGKAKKAAQDAKDKAAGITRGPGGGVAHPTHGSHSDKSGAGQRRKADKQQKAKVKIDAQEKLRADAEEKAKGILGRTLDGKPLSEADKQIIIGPNREKWIKGLMDQIAAEAKKKK